MVWNGFNKLIKMNSLSILAGHFMEYIHLSLGHFQNGMVSDRISALITLAQRIIYDERDGLHPYQISQYMKLMQITVNTANIDEPRQCSR